METEGQAHLGSWARTKRKKSGVCLGGTAAEAQCIFWAELCAPPNSYAEVLSHILQNVPLCGNKGVADVIG